MRYLPLFDPDNLGLCPEPHTLEGLSPLSFSSCDPLGASSWLNPFSRQTPSTQFPRIPYPNGPDPIFRASMGILGFILLRTDRTTRMSTSKSKDGQGSSVYKCCGHLRVCARPPVVQDGAGTERDRGWTLRWLCLYMCPRTHRY